MKKYLLLLSAVCISIIASAQHKSQKEILHILNTQQNAWNSGDLNGFMNGYWKNDSLMFIGKSGVTYGWDNTLANYKKGYSDTAKMGKLHFNILKVNRIDKQNYFVVGKWHLTRSIGDVGGHFTLFFRKINGEWVIVADHSS